jgi:H+/Cl- antiporter ClcA
MTNRRRRWQLKVADLLHAPEHLKRTRKLWLSRRRWRMRLAFWSGALAVGVMSVGFAKAADWAQGYFRHHLLVSPWIALFLTPAGFALAAWVCRVIFPGAQGSGIPQTIAARHTDDREKQHRLLSLRISVGKIVLTLLGLLCGASIGREGPTVQIGASIMLNVARWSDIGRQRGLILAGSAAGIAAAFNTPLAGIVFAIEEMSRSFELRTSGLVLSAVILSGLASLALIGNYDYFGEAVTTLHSGGDWLALALCGIFGGIAGSLFCRLILGASRRAQAWIATAPTMRALGFAACCGLVVALTGLLSHSGTYGTGYAEAKGAVEGTALPWSYAPLKFLATVASSLAGIPGGLFAPSLAIGAGIGSIVSHIVASQSVGAIVVLGMAGYLAGVVQAPITTFVIILEMTADHTMVVPLMIASVLGFGTSRFLYPVPLYHALAKPFIAGQSAPVTGND